MVSIEPDGREETMSSNSRPLGFGCGNGLPLKVVSVRQGICADEAGVKREWVVKSVNGEDFSQLTDRKVAVDILKKHSAASPDDAEKKAIVNSDRADERKDAL